MGGIRRRQIVPVVDKGFFENIGFTWEQPAQPGGQQRYVSVPRRNIDKVTAIAALNVIAVLSV